MKLGLSIGEVSAATGLSTYTLRYYEKEGLLPFVRKNSAGLRVYTENDLGWISMIECLKATGLTLKGIKQYIDWFKEGDATLPQRLAMFKKQKQDLAQKLTDLNNCMLKLDYKVRLYTEAVKKGSLKKASENKALAAEGARLFPR